MTEAKDKARLLSDSELRKFGYIMAVLIFVVFGIVLPMIVGKPIIIWVCIISVSLVVWAWLSPATLNGLYSVWQRISKILAWVNNRILLSAIFYLLITPIGLVRRLFNFMFGFTIKNESTTYRIQSSVRSPDHMEKPY